MDKAVHELNLSLSEGPNSFFPHAMNFSVTIHAIADHLWHVKAIHDPQWGNFQSRFVEWVKIENDCIAVFIDLSNTYKHSDRYVKNAFAAHIGLYPEASVQHTDSSDELRNRIVSNNPSGEVIYWPVVTTTTGLRDSLLYVSQ